ncbi:hypothetical protein C1S80_14810 [Mycolicibacterium aubagnense]|nr:hypothetical protein C1S80_14810 [Mycolicibacterium aubagnense]
MLIGAVAVAGGLALGAGVVPAAALAAPGSGPSVDYGFNRPHGGGHGHGGHGHGGPGYGGPGHGGGGHGFVPLAPPPHLCVPFVAC